MTEQPNDTDVTNDDPDADPEMMNARDLRGVTPHDEAAEGSDEPGTDADPETMNPREQ